MPATPPSTGPAGGDPGDPRGGAGGVRAAASVVAPWILCRGDGARDWPRSAWAAGSACTFRVPGPGQHHAAVRVPVPGRPGVDYTIFLDLAREETRDHGTRDGIVRAVSATGAVITSAGIVLAAVFCVLGVLPLIVLTQLGIIVGPGILLTPFLVRVVIPAMFTHRRAESVVAQRLRHRRTAVMATRAALGDPVVAVQVDHAGRDQRQHTDEQHPEREDQRDPHRQAAAKCNPTAEA